MKAKKVFYRLGYDFILMLIYLITIFLFRLRVRGKENIPEDIKKVVIVSSHTTYWDPPLVGLIMGPTRQVHFIARKGLLRNPVFAVPVRTYSTTINRDNFGKEDLLKMLRVFQSDDLLCIFPEGTTQDGVEPKSGTVRLAEKSNRTFLPMKIELSRSPLQFPFLFAPVNVVIGKPITFPELKEMAVEKRARSGEEMTIGEGPNGGTNYQRLARVLMEHINDLPGGEKG
ncbi:MAG: lysophospholipid acyltransferase family protein [Candidatus Acetothermia bacterium]